jgi:hypothetical protein
MYRQDQHIVHLIHGSARARPQERSSLLGDLADLDVAVLGWDRRMAKASVTVHRCWPMMMPSAWSDDGPGRQRGAQLAGQDCLGGHLGRDGDRGGRFAGEPLGPAGSGRP